MNVSFYIAKRYLFSKKSHNIINIISAIAVVGITFSTAALMIILSAFNGLEGLVSSLYNSFDSDIKITLNEGKTFNRDAFPEEELQNLPEIAFYTNVIEEVVMVKHKDNWTTVTMKGVEPVFVEMTTLDTFMVEGKADIFAEKSPSAIIGVGVQAQLGVPTDDIFDNRIMVSGLQRNEKFRRTNSSAFKQKPIANIGVFSLGPEFDYKFMVVPLSFAAEILDYDSEISSIELNLKENIDHDEAKAKIQTLLGEDFKVETLYEQNQAVYNIHKIEKWFIFIILTFVLLLATFNILASLAMLIIDKKHDITILKTMGAQEGDVQKIFFYQGILINLSGAIIGLTLGLLVCWLQMEFHLVKLHGAIIDYYPVVVKFSDVGLILFTVGLIGITSSYFPVRYFLKKY